MRQCVAERTNPVIVIERQELSKLSLVLQENSRGVKLAEATVLKLEKRTKL